jgi:spermidine synthase
VVEWNRGALGPLAGHPLNDRRVHVAVEDVRSTLRSNRDRFAAVLLDVDNGPVAMTATTNAGLYDNEGVEVARAALTDDGVLAVWSAADHRKFEQRLRHAGFDVTVEHVRARLKGGGPRHSIILGRKRPAAASGRADRAEREESHER